MSKAYAGTITKTFEKDWTDRDTNEDIVLHSFQIDTEKRFFRTGTDLLPAKEGDYIEFTANPKNNQVDLDSVKKGEAPAEAPKRAARTSSSGKSSGGKENWDARGKYWEEKERRDVEVVEPRITYMSSLNIASQIVAAAAASDALSFGNASQGKKLDMMVSWVEEIADNFFKKGMTASVPSAETEEE